MKVIVLLNVVHPVLFLVIYRTYSISVHVSVFKESYQLTLSFVNKNYILIGVHSFRRRYKSGWVGSSISPVTPAGR